ncbi:phytoene desaturase family protein [Hufsiella ginkgonis]|uniref:Phytoene desaturase n=1 Tax=Hufsiella ginkgonis TaxID=2695274 RepID=A0A7K1XYG1_9SPHI|nr:phytoene desaturase family protein [Hufsiella ginkgonis]MXV16044.1 phytoene desaturase [Hufsiella ginkgonis]
MYKIAIIGSGFSSLSAAAILAREGFEVTIYEKNDQPGGRARTWESGGFCFDMGPSWYWMPEVFENYFALFGKKVSDYYRLVRIDPSYRVWFAKNDAIDVPAGMAELEQLFEAVEPGSTPSLKKFLEEAAYKYRVSMQDYVFRPSLSILEFLEPRLLIQALRIELLTSMRKHVRKYFKDPRLVSLLEFPVLFLGATPQNTPAMYSLMNYADLVLGTWYPMGGMHQVVNAMVSVAAAQGVKFRLNTAVKHIVVTGDKASAIETDQGIFQADLVLSGADYEHTDQQLLAGKFRGYSTRYWESRTLSPSCLIFYLGINKKLSDARHHQLFFDQDFGRHAHEIYEQPVWPSKPLFYVSCSSVTDPGVAPAGCENLFFLMPLAPGLPDNDELREKYFEIMITRFETVTGERIRDSIMVKRSYALNDFTTDYHSFKGNAYGLANTLLQTAFLKPKMRSKKVKNLFYTGQLTVPGPGVPPAIISGQVAAKEVIRYLKGKQRE